MASEMKFFVLYLIFYTYENDIFKLFADLDMGILKIRSSTVYPDIASQDLAVALSNKNNNNNNNNNKKKKKKMEILRCTKQFNKMLKVIFNACFMFQESLG